MSQSLRSSLLTALLCALILLPLGCSDSQDSVFTSTGDSDSAINIAQDSLVISRNGSLVRLDRQGQNEVLLTSGHQDSEPDFHPLGTSLVFSRLSGGARDIYVVGSDGSEPKNLTSEFALDAFSPHYSTDGAYILFSARAATAQTTSADTDIYVMAFDGSQVRLLTPGADIDGQPAFSGDGKFVVFQRAVGNLSKISRVPIAGGAVVDLTDGTHDDQHPSYCPPGDPIVFTRDGVVSIMPGDHQPGDTSTITPLGNQSNSFTPDHSLEHDQIFFLASPSANDPAEIWSINTEGQEEQQLTQGLGAQSLTVGPATPPAAPNQVTVEIVNDSGLDEDKVFVLVDTPQVAGQVIEGPLTLLTDSGGPNSSATAVSLQSIAVPNGPTTVSPHTGKTLPIHSLVVKNLESGQFNFSYDPNLANGPVKIVNGASPTAQEPYRFDKMELTYLNAPAMGTPGGGGNLTSIDFFGIPLSVEVTHWNEIQADPLQTKTFHASTSTLLKTFASVGAGMASGAGWSLDTVGQTFDPNSTDFTNFARILSPNTIAAADTPQGRPDPYPSFETYLQSIVGQTFTLNGRQHGGYTYTGTILKDGNDFKIECTGTLTVAAPSPLPNNAKVTLLLPIGQPGSATNPATSLDFFIYACAPNKSSYTVEGFPFTGSTDAEIQVKVGQANSSAYGSIVGDVHAALNFGYIGGKFGSDIADLYTAVVLPYPYPYGGARTVNDGFYNPYAAIFYYLSDSYGHPFSDRIAAASPLYTLVPGDTVRITLLNDARLDTPLVQETSSGNTSLGFSWQAVPGATGYTAKVSPTPSNPVPSITGTTLELTGLEPGTPYLVSVTATGANAIISGTQPVEATTTGTRNFGAAGDIKFQGTLSLPDDLLNLASFNITIDGQAVNPTQNANLQGKPGLNIFDVTIKNGTTLVYQGNLLLQLVRSGAGTWGTGNPFTLVYNLTPLTIGAPTAEPFPDQSNTVIGVPFTPKPFYEFFETKFP